MNKTTIRTWMRPTLQGVTFLGLAVIVLVWAGIAYHLNVEYRNAERNGFLTTANLARAFEVHVGRSIQEINNTLLILRAAYLKDPDHFEFKTWVDNPAFRAEQTWLFHLADENGIVKATSTSPVLARIEVSRFKHFSVHVHATEDELFISEPMIGLTSGQWSVQLTRRITRADGSFGGVIGAAINPEYFAAFYKSIDVGHDGSISLSGFDAIVRAYGGRRQNMVGRSVAYGEIFPRFRTEPFGSFHGVGKADGIRRLMSYRVVPGFPLIVSVGVAEADVFADFAAKRTLHYGFAAALTVFILVGIGFAILHRYKLDRAQDEIAEQNRRFEAALNNMSQGLAMYGADRRLVVCNAQYARMYDMTPDEVKPGTPFQTIIEHRLARGVYAGDVPWDYIRSQVSTMSQPSHRIQELKDGRMIAVARQSMPGGGWLTTHEDVTETQRANERMAYVARHDALTDLANRTVLLEEMEQALERAHRVGTGFAVFLLDLDLFKAVNDSLGHAVGDQLLKAVADRVRECARDSEVVARLGGDEFAILQPMKSNRREELVTLANRLLESVRMPYDLDGSEAIIETSIGIAVGPEDGDEPIRLLKNADLALYRAKSDGRNGYQFFAPEMDAAAQDRRQLELDLRNGILRNEFVVHYQRVVDTATKETCSVEALVRWNHPREGLLGPDRFIPLSEETGLIIPLGDWILRKACSDAASWTSSIKVAVNLSPIQFRKGKVVNAVKRALAESGLPPQRLELEVTESVLLQGNDANLDALRQLRAIGVSVVLDDFGTGYSSLSYLRMFPFDKLKIDRSFVKELSNNSDCGAIVCAITGLGSSLNMTITAEGVETEEQFELLRAAGCEQAQGYLFGRPAPAHDLGLMSAEVIEIAAEKVVEEHLAEAAA